MDFFETHLLTVLVFVPLCGALLALAFPKGEHTGVRGLALVVTLIDFALALWMWQRFDPHVTAMQLTERTAWIPNWGITYSLGVDGLSLLLIVLSTFLAPLVILSTYSSVTERAREYMVCVLLLQTAMLGAFVATDLFLFYVFWEAMLIPMYFLVGVWGGRRRIYAAIKFFLYTMAGSLLMLVAILYTVWAVAGPADISFNWADVVARLSVAHLGAAEPWLFAAFALAFAIKVPMFPFHTWLPDAHVEAPTGGSVILAGVMLKLGTFGFLRYALWLYPQAAALFLPTLGTLATFGIVYGAVVAMVQTDLKRLVAYSSVSHLGFVMLGMTAMTATSVSGSVLQMVNHGISTGALFLLVGVIYERRHTRELADFGGIAKSMPLYCSVFVLIALSSIGLPGLNGFVGEFLILMGTFESHGTQVGWLGSGTLSTHADLALLGTLLLQAVALTALIILGIRLARAKALQRISTFSCVAAMGFAVALSLCLVAPAWGSFAGGWLTWPLNPLRHDPTPFAEIYALLAVVAASGVIFAAVYLLVAVQRVFFGPIKHAENAHLRDLSGRECLVLAPLVLVAIIMGVYPQPFLDVINPTVSQYAAQFRLRAGMAPQ
jgi:NADH-quinone oxidoreductase subunit M